MIKRDKSLTFARNHHTALRSTKVKGGNKNWKEEQEKGNREIQN